MALTTVAADVYRDYDLDGVPASGPHKPKKLDIRRLIGGIEQVVNAFTSAGGLIYDTRALLYADLAKSANSLAWVISDTTVDYNGVYKKVGASGAGSWARVADLPYSFIVASDQGAGAANAIEATTSIPVSSSALVLLNIFETNGDGPITVRFNGSGPVYTIKTNAGNDPVSGGLVSGMLVVGRVSGSIFRLVNDQASAAILAQAEAAAAEAAAARDAALSAVPNAFPTTRTALKALDTSTIKTAYLTEQGREGQFVWRTGNFTSYAASDVNEGVYVKADAVAVSSGMWVRVFTEITPRMFGATGFFAGSTDDGPALNRMFDYVRTLLAGQGERRNIGLVINLSGAWSVATPINATNIVAWSLAINGGLLIGECTGKPIMDLVGSRGYSLNHVAFYGSKTNRPSCAYQLARPTADGFCDNNSFVEVSTTGWFSRTAIHCYGHETAKHDHCTYFNYDHTARVAIFEGFNGTPFTSDYTTVMTGATSFINNKLVNCDFRYLPVDENVRAITGVTNAASGVITAPGHQFAVNDQVVFAYVGGMPNMSKLVATVTAVTANTITINQSTVGLGAYTSGGIVVRRQSVPSVYLSRAQQFNFDCCYIVAYGREQLELDFPDSTKRRLEQIDLDILFEGSGNTSNILWSLRSSSCNVQGIRLKTYNGNAANAWFGFAQLGALTLYGADLQYVTPLYGNVPIAGGGQEAAFAIFGNNIVCTDLSQIPYTGMAGFKGFVTAVSTGNFYSRGVTAL